jgi:hypothetical protein
MVKNGFYNENMNANQSAAYINAQMALMTAETQAMIAENLERQNQGLSLAYGPNEWFSFIKQWKSVIGHNAVAELFRENN